MFAERLSDSLDFYQETVMGMGYVHTSSVAQRLSITVLLRWYQIFKELDAPFLAAERKQLRGIRCWINTWPPGQPCHRIRTSSRTDCTLATSSLMISQLSLLTTAESPQG